MNVSPTSNQQVENVYWPLDEAPKGHYKVHVHHFRNHGRPGCSDPTTFRVAVSIGGVAQEFSGSISHGSPPLLVHEFDLDDKALLSIGGGNTDMGTALQAVANELRIPPMTDRALPPVLVLISDGQPTDDFTAGLRTLMGQAWGKKSVRIAIGIGEGAGLEVLQQFIDHSELEPLRASNPEALVRYIRGASTAVLQAASAPASQVSVAARAHMNVPIPVVPRVDNDSSDVGNIW